METSTENETLESEKAKPGSLILYDGVCGLCNHFVNTVLDNDPQGKFQFASLQSELGRSILTTMGKDPAELKTIYLVLGYGQQDMHGQPEMKVLCKARAALQIFGELEGPLRFLKIFSILPTWLLNLGYDLVAANRYKIFGRLDACPLPTPDRLKRFLDL
jgi:predicted DCC family thiol-disulfide oxidoreductase YuxK